MPRRLTPPDPPLTDGVIRLEPLSARDRAAAWEMAQDEDVKRFTYVPTNSTESWVHSWLDTYAGAWRDGTRAGFSIRSVDDGTFIGFAAIVRLDLDLRQGEIGYIVSPHARGRGVAARAVELITRWGFEELGLERLELRIDARNDASQRVAERSGYRLDGVLRSLAFKEGLRTDTGVWSRLRADKL
ncbi:MAG TPA: GNAT family N-acetyltransferase [Gaiellaceae bacterium]|nr:GNAT family N-acetyltransferase [Gaiellaceae bacterium]